MCLPSLELSFLGFLTFKILNNKCLSRTLENFSQALKSFQVLFCLLLTYVGLEPTPQPQTDLEFPFLLPWAPRQLGFQVCATTSGTRSVFQPRGKAIVLFNVRCMFKYVHVKEKELISASL